jgi:hypothetical protein
MGKEFWIRYALADNRKGKIGDLQNDASASSSVCTDAYRTTYLADPSGEMAKRAYGLMQLGRL